MAILSMGTAVTDDVEAALNLTAPINPTTQDGAMITRIVQAAESFVKIECRRSFEHTAYTDEAYDIEPGTKDLLLTDRPVDVLTSIAQVETRNTDGTFTTRVIPAGEYVVDKTAGIVTLIFGWFYPGPQALLATWTAGYAPADITASANNEICVLKQLCLSIVQNWFKKRKDQIGHMASVSFGDESVTINFDLTGDEKRLLNQLKR